MANDRLVVFDEDADGVSMREVAIGETVETVFDQAGERAFVATNVTDDVSVIDAEAWEETARCETGLYPDCIPYLER